LRTALFISLKDVRRAYRDPAGIAMMLLAPLVLTLLLGAAFGGEVGQSLTPVPVVLVDEDGGESARSLVGGLEAAGGEGLLELSRVDTREQAEAAIDAGNASAAIIIPEGFSEAFSGGWSLGGAGIQVELLQDPAASVGPRLVAGVLRQLISSFNGAWAAGAAAAVEAGAPGLAAIPESDGGFPAEPGGDLAAAQDAAEAAVHRFRELQAGTQPPQIESQSPRIGDAEATEVSVTGAVLAGMMIFFMLIAGANAARSILEEDQAGTLARLFTTPTSRAAVLGGKFLSAFLAVLLQAVILVAAGWLLFGIHWGSPVAVMLLILMGSLVSAGLGVMLNSFVRTPPQAGAIASGVVVFLGLVGGSFTGTLSAGGAFDVLRRLTPNGWLLEAWDLTMRGAPLADLGLPLLAVGAFALLFFLVGSWSFRRRYA